MKNRQWRWGGIWGLTILLASAAVSEAQAPRYGEVKLPAQASGDELSAQSDLWVMEVYFRPMRLIVVDLTDPKTGEKKPEFIWYIPYRAINRKLPSRSAQESPNNEFDPPVQPPKFVPEFTLVTTDTETPEVFQDEVLPEALAVIRKRERAALQSSVEVVGDVPPATAPNDPDQKVIQGVAMWRGLDPDADRYTVYFTGFSNGLRKVVGADGTEVVQTKTIMTKYWRPGDRFEQRESEIRMDGNPEWIYR